MTNFKALAAATLLAVTGFAVAPQAAQANISMMDVFEFGWNQECREKSFTQAQFDFCMSDKRQAWEQLNQMGGGELNDIANQTTTPNSSGPSREQMRRNAEQAMRRYNQLRQEYNALSGGTRRVCTVTVEALDQLQVIRDNKSYMNGKEGHARAVSQWNNQLTSCRREGFRG